MADLNRDRLGKIVALAKGGVGGEKENAIRMVQKICKEHNLNFDDVMNSLDVEEFEIKYDTKDEERVLIGCIFKYGLLHADDPVMTRERSFRWMKTKEKSLSFTTTKSKYVEVLNAFSVLKRKFKEERKIADEAFHDAFRKKHDLFYDPTPEERERIEKRMKEEKDKKTDKEKADDAQKAMMAMGIVGALNNADIHKQLNKTNP